MISQQRTLFSTKFGVSVRSVVRMNVAYEEDGLLCEYLKPGTSLLLEMVPEILISHISYLTPSERDNPYRSFVYVITETPVS
jgi:hypothetical protein